MPTKIGFHAFHVTLYMHEIFGLILFLTPMDYSWSSSSLFLSLFLSLSFSLSLIFITRHSGDAKSERENIIVITIITEAEHSKCVGWASWVAVFKGSNV